MSHDEQTTLFPPLKISPNTHAKLAIDGACRGNPGPAGAGAVITLSDGTIHTYSGYLGVMTNNCAEYHALLLGLFTLIYDPLYTNIKSVAITTDSQLLARQLTGVYKVKHPNIIPLANAARTMLKCFSTKITHVLREYNTAADAAANVAVDEKRPLPAQYRATISRAQ